MIIEVVIWIVFNSVPQSYFADSRIITVRIQLADRGPQALIKIYHALFAREISHHFMSIPHLWPPSIGKSQYWSNTLREARQTSAFIVPCRACLWFLLNLGSVPFREGYLEVFGFLILSAHTN